MANPHSENETVSKIEQIAGLALLVFLLVGVFLILKPFMSALLWAAIFAFSTWPIFLWLNKRMAGKPNLTALTLTLGLACVVVLPLLVLGLTFADDATTFLRKLPGWLDQGLPTPSPSLIEIPYIGEWLHGMWYTWSQDSQLFFDDIRRYLTKYLPQIQSTLLNLGATLGQGILELTLSLLLAFFFYRDGLYVVERTTAVLEKLTGSRAKSLLITAGDTVKRVVNGILGTALAQGVLAAIGFWLAGVPGALILGLSTFFLSLIPMGPPLIWLPATLWLFFTGETGWGIFLLLWGALVVSGVDNIMKPYLISRGGSLPLVIVLLGVFGGLLTFGFIGLFLGPTLLAVAYSLITEWLATRRPRHPD